jgi:tRNA(fMet)-specific endonuclease VapC
MLILDTDHFSELLRSSPCGLQLEGRLAESPDELAVTIVSIEEQSRGWLNAIRQAKSDKDLMHGYQKFQSLVSTSANWEVLGWDSLALATFHTLRAAHPRIGTMDLRIASIAMARDGKLLSRNLKDFERIAGLRVENWLE